MSAVAAIAPASLPAMIRTAAHKLASAENAAEVLDARNAANFAYHAAKAAGRLAKAKQAHDEVITTVYRAQADALEIEALAKRRLADEYDAAQERGEVQSRGGDQSSKAELPTSADLGLSRKDIHEARQIRDAEVADPGIVRRALDGLLDAGEQPTAAAVKRVIGTAPARPQPRVSDKALWLWGRLCDLEREGILNLSPRDILTGMTPAMIADTARLAPMVREFLEDLEVCLEPA